MTMSRGACTLYYTHSRSLKWWSFTRDRETSVTKMPLQYTVKIHTLNIVDKYKTISVTFRNQIARDRSLFHNTASVCRIWLCNIGRKTSFSFNGSLLDSPKCCTSADWYSSESQMAYAEQEDWGLSEALVEFPVKAPILSIVSSEYLEIQPTTLQWTYTSGGRQRHMDISGWKNPFIKHFFFPQEKTSQHFTCSIELLPQRILHF